MNGCPMLDETKGTSLALQVAMQRAASLGYKYFRTTKSGALIGYKPTEPQGPYDGTLFVVKDWLIS